MLNPVRGDPLVALHESTSAELSRLSANIATLTQLMEDSEHRGLGHLTAMFVRARQGKVDEARRCIARSPRE